MSLKSPASAIYSDHPTLTKDINENFVDIVTDALDLQYTIDQYSRRLQTYSEVIPKYIPYISRDINLAHFEFVRDTISNKFNAHKSHWVKDFKTKLPFIFASVKSKRIKPLPSVYNKNTTKATSIVDKFVVDDVEELNDITTQQQITINIVYHFPPFVEKLVEKLLD